MHIAGYIASALIGISLGLIGGGGSILTVPVLVYLFGYSPLMATSYSLFVVGSTSLVGAYNNWRKGFVSIKTAFLFGITSVLTVYLTRKFILPNIPDHIVTIRGFVITESLMLMVLFAILMFAASISMIRSKERKDENAPHLKKNRYPEIIFYGFAIGFITGFLGAGGGFLLIPTLVLILHLPMKQAIGTSLLIIAMNNLIGFIGDLEHMSMDWTFLFTISAIAIAGVIVGGSISKKMPGVKLKKGFGWFVLAISICILVGEIFWH